MEGMAEDVQVLLDGLKLANKVKRPVVLKVGDSGLVVDLKKYKAYEGSVPEGGEKAEFTVTLEKETLQGLITEELDPVASFISGKIKVKGNMGVIMQLQTLQPRLNKLRSKY